jgi:1,4-alpha-glucan branching enzyme
VSDLNRVYRAEPALHATDNDPGAFRWAVADDAGASVYAFERKAADGSAVLTVSNMTPVVRTFYPVWVSRAGTWREAINTNAGAYGGDNLGNGGQCHAEAEGGGGVLSLTLPPLSTLILA